MLFFLKPVFSPNKLKLLKLDLNSISDQNNTLKNLLIFDGLVKYHRSARIVIIPVSGSSIQSEYMLV